GRSEGMQSVFKIIGQLAGSDATVLITGESGTGKELVARAIYHHSQRNAKTFLAINCAAIPENLLESELFGHEKGAFTGATAQRIGKFEQCHQGTIFLDEIGDMTPSTQAKILRVLQSGEFERVGGNQPIAVDVRVIAATHKALEQAVAAREFREDLFYRLNVVRLQIPPLRERRGDIPLLVNYFLKKFAEAQGRAPKSILPAAAELLERFHWPGNVRELENAVQRATVMAKGDVILPGDLPAEVSSLPGSGPAPAPGGAAPAGGGGPVNWESVGRMLFRWARQEGGLKVLPAVERELIIQALLETKGNQVQAARLLGITRATLRKRVDKFKITQELAIQ
ncbi:MAG: sigma-54 dependent transcriptional regulator, partial [Bryobacteraceae bacterium]